MSENTANFSFNDVFKGIEILPVRFAEERKAWQGDTLSFLLTAKMGLVSTPIRGTIEVTDRNITIDVDLGMFERLVPATKVREVICSSAAGFEGSRSPKIRTASQLGAWFDHFRSQGPGCSRVTLLTIWQQTGPIECRLQNFENKK